MIQMCTSLYHLDAQIGMKIVIHITLIYMKFIVSAFLSIYGI